MCGIFGALFVSSLSSVNGAGALKSLHHRGPDSQALYEDPKHHDVLLGHTRLSIIDLSPLGAQPMLSADKSIVVVFNGEIYNHHELRVELEALGHVFRSRSDTEVIVEGYRAWGDGIVHRLDGMFAICIYDQRERRALLARDRCGKKPLFYATGPDGLRFASEIKAIEASGLRLSIEERALPSMLVMGYNPAPTTMYREVKQVPPASMMVMTPSGPKPTRRYWHAPFVEPSVRDDLPTAKATVRRLVEAAVKRRLEADVPLGAFLSGGIDSSIVVGLMAQLSDRPVKTFSIGFSGDPRFDETHFARIAAKTFRTEHTEFVVEPTALDLVESLVHMHDGPFGDSSAIPTSIVSKLTREHVTVALTGDGGDELFCGYTRFLASEVSEYIPHAIRELGMNAAAHLGMGSNMRSLWSRSTRFLRVASRPLAQRMMIWSGYFGHDLHEVLRDDLRASLPVEEPYRWNESLINYRLDAGVMSRILHHNFEGYLPYDLLVKADRSSMLHSIELRSPFLDTALIEYAARLPDRYRRRGLRTKWLLKEAFADILPREILNRGKMGFGVPLGTWFRSSLREYIEEHLGSSARVFQYLKRSYVERVLQEHFSNRADHGQRLWLLLTLEVWLRGRDKMWS
jgi:asparagine synthase (glutamine-hydrolysing)